MLTQTDAVHSPARWHSHAQALVPCKQCHKQTGVASSRHCEQGGAPEMLPGCVSHTFRSKPMMAVGSTPIVSASTRSSAGWCFGSSSACARAFHQQPGLPAKQGRGQPQSACRASLPMKSSQAPRPSSLIQPHLHCHCWRSAAAAYESQHRGTGDCGMAPAAAASWRAENGARRAFSMPEAM